MDFKKSPPQTEPSPSHPEKKSCYPCVFPVRVHKPRLPRSLGDSASHIASRPIHSRAPFLGYSSAGPCPLQNIKPWSRWRVPDSTGLSSQSLRSQSHLSSPLAPRGCQLSAKYVPVFIMKRSTWCLVSRRAGFSPSENFSKPGRMSFLIVGHKAL